MQLRYILVDLTSINIEFCTQNYQIKVLSDLIWLSWPKSTKFSLSVTVLAFELPVLSVVWNCSQKDFTYTHLQKMWLIESLSRLQKEQLMSFSIPMCIKTILVAYILCRSRIWNHFIFISWMFCIFLKFLLQSMSVFNLASHFSQHLGLSLPCVSIS